MSNFAYEDKERKNKVFANELNISKHQNKFFCPNINCNAALVFVNSSNNREAYFRAIPTKEHNKYCPYDHKNEPTFNNSKYIEETFNFNEVAKYIILGKGKSVKNRLETLPALYRMCLSKALDDSYNNFKIFKILFNKSSLKFFNNFSPCVIECTFLSYTNKGEKYRKNNKEYEVKLNQIKVKFPNNHIVTLYFKDETLYKSIRGIIYNYANIPFVILAYWKYKENSIYTYIERKNQFYFPKNL